MLRRKKICAVCTLLAMLLSIWPSAVWAAPTVGLNATVTAITADDTMIQNDPNQHIAFDFKIEHENGALMNPGDSVTLPTNMGALFNTEWDPLMKNLPIRDAGGQTVATADIDGSTITITFTDALEATAFFEGTLATGKKLTVRNVGATPESDVQRDLTIGTQTHPITFKAPKSEGPGPQPPDSGDLRPINNALLEKGAWSIHHNSGGHARIHVNQIGSLSLFKATQDPKYSSWVPAFEPLENVVIEDPIPENGIIDPASLTIQAVRYAWVKATNPDANYPDRNSSGFFLGAIYPVERQNDAWSSAWHPGMKDKMQLLTQTDGESYAAFRERIRAQKLSYGIYTDSTTGGDTFLANFGDLSANGTVKYTDFEPQLVAQHPEITNIYGEGGPSAGHVVTFMVDFDTYYPTLIGEKKLKNPATMTSETKTANILSNEYLISNGNGIGVGSSGSVVLKVVDRDDRSQAIEGAVFKVQKKVGANWQDLLVNGKPVSGTTDSNGILLLRPLPAGDFRLLQTATKSGYAFDNKSYEPNKAGDVIVGLSPAETGEFTVAAGDKLGYATIVPNAKQPTPVDAAYVVEHHQQNADGQGYTLKDRDEKTGPIGGVADVTAKTYDGFTPDEKASTYEMTGSAPSATVLSIAADGSLVVKRYYNRNTYALTYDANGGKGEVPKADPQRAGATVSVLFKPAPQKSGYRFLGWSEDATATEATYRAKGTDTFTMPARDVTLYAIYQRSGGSGGSGGSGPSDPPKPPPAPPEEPEKPPVTVPEILNTVDHFAYVVGYPDHTFRPERSISRAEVTTIFTRLMLEQMAINGEYPNPFSDVAPHSWYAKPIGYAQSKGFANGYPDRTFKPDAPITRAEFASICARFDTTAIALPALKFSDLPDTHWAYDSVARAQALGWIKGYPDQTFAPDQPISREEVVAVVNRMLNRRADKAFISEHRNALVQYTDLPETHWSYLDIMEASHSHDYERKDNGDEKWLKLTPNK